MIGPNVAKPIAGLIIFAAALFSFSATAAAACPPGWSGPNKSGFCYRDDLVGKPTPCNGACEKCAAQTGSTCVDCLKKLSCLDRMQPGRFKNYQTTPVEPAVPLPRGGDKLFKVKP